MPSPFSGLRDYVRENYPEEFRQATWTKELGSDGQLGSDFMTLPAAHDTRLAELRARVTKWRIAAAFAMAGMTATTFIVFALAK